ncbi:unnamed protein product, partial [Rotaria sp. Silwood2]
MASNQNPSLVIPLQASGHLRSKKVYFLSWQPTADQDSFCKSLQKLVLDAIEMASTENFRSISFPAIGCSQYGYPPNLIAKILIEEAYRLVDIHGISISFTIEPDKIDIYQEFKRQIDLLKESKEPSDTPVVSIKVGNGTISVEKGTIITQKVDAIIGSSSSKHLKKAIIKAAGRDVESAYQTEYLHNPDAILISTISGQLPCKRIFFLKWQPESNEGELRQSIKDFISNVIQHVISYKYSSVAFPAIGCGHHNCSVTIVVETMVNAIKKELERRGKALAIKFVIEPGKQNVYDEFCKHVLASER